MLPCFTSSDLPHDDNAAVEAEKNDDSEQGRRKEGRKEQRERQCKASSQVSNSSSEARTQMWEGGGEVMGQTKRR